MGLATGEVGSTSEKMNGLTSSIPSSKAEIASGLFPPRQKVAKYLYH